MKGCIYISHIFSNLKGMLEHRRTNVSSSDSTAFPDKMLKRGGTPLSKNNIITCRHVNPACLIGQHIAMLPTIPRRINSITETHSRIVTPNIIRTTNERRCILPLSRWSLYHSPAYTDTHGCKFITVLEPLYSKRPMLSMAASSDFDVIEREREEEKESERRAGGTGGHFVDNVFQRWLHGNVRRIDIRSTPGEGDGGPKAPERRGVLPWSGWKGTERRGQGTLDGERVFRTASLFRDDDHYSIRFHFSFRRKTIWLFGIEWVAFFERRRRCRSFHFQFERFCSGTI